MRRSTVDQRKNNHRGPTKETVEVQLKRSRAEAAFYRRCLALLQKKHSKEKGVQPMFEMRELCEIIDATLCSPEGVGSVAELCRLGRVPRCTFYRWLKEKQQQ